MATARSETGGAIVIGRIAAATGPTAIGPTVIGASAIDEEIATENETDGNATASGIAKGNGRRSRKPGP